MLKTVFSIKPLSLIIVATLTGCTVTPQDFSQADISRINEADRSAAFAEMEPHGDIITLDEAIARALKYNLDQRVRLMEQSLASKQLEAGNYDMLPKLLANAGYSTRDDYSVRYSAPLDDPSNFRENGDRSELDVSSEKSHTTADLTLSWNLLDFGASYYTARQNGDKLLIANERRRKAMHTLIQNVRTAYWRAVAAEKLNERVLHTIGTAERALQDSFKLSAERVSVPGESLRFQRNLLESLRLLESVEREMASSRIELSSLIGLLPGTRFKLQEPEVEVLPLEVDMAVLEVQALVQNADLREQFYNVRIAAQDTRKALLSLLPGISFEYGLNYDNDRFLLDEQWRTAGMRVSANLFNLISAPSRMRAAEKNEALAEARRMALQMSVLTQVHLARHQYNDSLRQFKRADQLYQVDAQLEAITSSKAQSNLIGDQTLIAANVTSILSELRRYQAMAKVQESIGRLQSSLGVEPELSSSVDSISLADLRTRVQGWLDTGLDPVKPVRAIQPGKE